MEIQIKHSRDIEDRSRFRPGDICGYEGSTQEFLVVGEDDIYVHTFVIGTGQYWGILKLQRANLDCVQILVPSKDR